MSVYACKFACMCMCIHVCACEYMFVCVLFICLVACGVGFNGRDDHVVMCGWEMSWEMLSWELLLLVPILVLLEMNVKLEAERTARHEATERYARAEHQSSMLELDLKNAQGETASVKIELNAAMAKVCVCEHACMGVNAFACVNECVWDGEAVQQSRIV